MARELTLISDIEEDSEGITLARDLDGRSRLCSLFQTHGGEVAVRLDGLRYVVPREWVPHVRQIRWCGDTEAVVWPISSATGGGPYIGTVGASGVSAITSAYPLDVFADNGFVVPTFSEELIKTEAASADEQSDLISVFHHHRKIGRFWEPFIERFSHEHFLEVTRGVVDGMSGRFWFTAYRTDHIWSLSLDESMVVQVGELGCSLGDVLAICCADETATVVLRQGSRMTLRTYLRSNDGVTFQSEAPLIVPVQMNDLLAEAAGEQRTRIAGLRGNSLALLAPHRSVLASF